MKALMFVEANRAVVEDLPDPRPGEGEVVVRSRTVGICHSDLELLAGNYIIPFQFPVIPGHEWSGEVAEVGRGVDGLRIGDRVVGECVVGPAGRDHFGFSIPGAAAEYFVARAEWLHKLPDNLSFTQGALIEPFSVAYNAVRTAAVDPSDRVAVIGGGPIGLLSVLAASACGGEVTLFEPREDRRQLGVELGAAHSAVPATPDDTPAGGFDVVIEAAGVPQAMASSLALADKGARVVFVGIDTGRPASAKLGQIQSKALRMEGIIGSSGIWPQAIRFLSRINGDPGRIVTARYPLAEATEGLHGAEVGSGNVKVHLEMAS